MFCYDFQCCRRGTSDNRQEGRDINCAAVERLQAVGQQ